MRASPPGTMCARDMRERKGAHRYSQLDAECRAPGARHARDGYAS
jgi:hypothetical protein